MMKQHNIVTAISVIGTLLVPVAKSWAVGFYSGTNCWEDDTYDDLLYSGEGDKYDRKCYVVGQTDPELKCDYYFNNVQNHSDCPNVALNPRALSVFFPYGTLCGVGYDPDCLLNDFSKNPLQCHSLEELTVGYDGSQVMTFMCYDGEPGIDQ